MSLTVLARKCAARGLAGFEWAVSVPGTVGGAVVNNAGRARRRHGGLSAQRRRWSTPKRGTQVLDSADLAYEYRSSSLKRGRIAVFW